MIDQYEQNDIWGNFRVAQRGYPINITSSPRTISAGHNCYKRIGVYISRSIEILSNNDCKQLGIITAGSDNVLFLIKKFNCMSYLKIYSVKLKRIFLSMEDYFI